MATKRKKHKKSQGTVSFHRAPHFLQFNPYIKSGYRVYLTNKQCFHSVFSWSNETLNIWTHLIGFGVFLGLFVYDLMVVFQKYKGDQYDAIVVAFVLFTFMLCMLLSSLYHTLNCKSENSCRSWLSYDVLGISAAFLAIFLSGIYYGFWCPENTHIGHVYMALVAGLFIAATAFNLTPRFMGNEWDTVRVFLFSGWAISGFLPTLHWVIIHGGLGSTIVKIFLPRIFVMYGISGAAVVIYASKIPERFFPGRFDYIGASHQLWHIIIVAALVYWHQSGLHYAQFRLTYGCNIPS